MPRLRSAVKLGQRPTAAILMEPDPNGEWSKVDYLLVDAYFTLDSEICSMCQNPIWLCHSTDNRIDFIVSKRTCYAKAEQEDFEKGPKGKNLSSGEYLISRAAGIEGVNGEREPLPTRREAYSKLQTD